MMKAAYEPGSVYSNQSGFQRFLFLTTGLSLLVITFLILSFTLFSLIGMVLEQSVNASLLCSIPLMLIICGCIVLLLRRMILLIFTRYRFEHEGLRVKHPLQRSKLIPWTDFQQVGIYFFNTNPRYLAQPDNISLCCVHKRAKKNTHGHWRLTQPNMVFSMRYSPELYAGLCEMCTIPITDLRLGYKPKSEKDPWR